MRITELDLAPIVPILSTSGQKTFLHVGCGTAGPARLPSCFKNEQWIEIRLDIDPAVNPHIVADITDLAKVRSSSVEAIWSSHNLEHLEGYQVGVALREFLRVLKPGGFLLATLPDIGLVAKEVVEHSLEKTLYVSPAGPITPLDILFGHQKSISKGNKFMAHRTGFTRDTLSHSLAEVGFDNVYVRPGVNYDLWAIAVKSEKAQSSVDA